MRGPHVANKKTIRDIPGYTGIHLTCDLPLKPTYNLTAAAGGIQVPPMRPVTSWSRAPVVWGGLSHIRLAMSRIVSYTKIFERAHRRRRWRRCSRLIRIFVLHRARRSRTSRPSDNRVLRPRYGLPASATAPADRGSWIRASEYASMAERSDFGIPTPVPRGSETGLSASAKRSRPVRLDHHPRKRRRRRRGCPARLGPRPAWRARRPSLVAGRRTCVVRGLL